MPTDAEWGAWLVAERDHQLGEARAAALDSDQTIDALREQVVDQALDSGLRDAGIDRRDVADLIDVVDRSRFVRDDGAVDTDRLSTFVESLRKAEPVSPVERRPPPRGGDFGRRVSSGQGRYLEYDRGRP